MSLPSMVLGLDNQAGRLPIPETPIALAVQSVLAGDMATAGGSTGAEYPDTSLAELSAAVPGADAGRDAGVAQAGLNAGDTTGQRAEAGSERSLRLSQMMLAAPPAAQPRWMSLPDTPPQLRSARELAQPMPGAAGVGQPDNVSAQRFPAGALAPARDAALPLPSAAGTVPQSMSGKDSGSSGVLGWEVPPIRWGGNLGYSLQISHGDTGSYTSNSQGVFANLTAASYIYAPWFAMVSGRIGVTTSSMNSDNSSANSGVGTADSSRNANVIGGAELNMLSSSRYPFRAYFDRTDSRNTGTIVATDYVSNRYGLSQSFRSEDGLSSGNLLLDRSDVSTEDGNRNEVTAVSGNYSKLSGIVQNNISGRYSYGHRSDTGDEATLFGLNSSHYANISDTLNVGATANYSDSDIRSSYGLGPTTTNRGRYFQLYGYGTWLPEFEDIEDLPLTLSGGVRYSGQDTQFGGDSFTGQTLGGNVSALYRYNSNLSLSANGALTKLIQNKGESQLLSQLGTAINYVGNPLNIGNYSYNWNTGVNANWQSQVAATPANTVLNGQASHSLSRLFTLAPGRTVAVNASQSLNLIDSAILGKAQTLTHTVSANFGLADGERFSGTLSTMLSDVRTKGYIEQDYQVFNIGLYGQGQLSQVSSANINLMFNWSDQSYQSVDAFGFPINQTSEHMSVNGSASYSHMRFAGVRGLRYNLIFAADSRLRDDRLYGDFNSSIDRTRFALTNRLEYRIGLLDFRLSLVNADVGGKKNALLFFQVSRQIGSY